MMSGQDPWRGQLAYHELVRIRRDNELFDWEWTLRTYITVVLAEVVPLRFRLRAGQPVYNVFHTEMQVVSDRDQPLDVYLDASRRWIFHPSEILIVGTPTMETFLIRLDFSSQPDFDTTVYNRLRLEHVYRGIRESSPIHYDRLLRLYQFCRQCQAFLPGHRYNILPLEDAYRFLEEYRFLYFLNHGW